MQAKMIPLDCMKTLISSDTNQQTAKHVTVYMWMRKAWQAEREASENQWRQFQHTILPISENFLKRMEKF